MAEHSEAQRMPIRPEGGGSPQAHYFIEDKSLPDDYRMFPYYYKELAFRFTSNSGIFSHGHVDEATDILIKNMPPLRGSLLDLGCGYGVIGIVLCKAYNLTLTLADINPRALRCAEINCGQNGVKANILTSDGFENIPGKFDAIALNPPIHAGKDLVYTMLEGAGAHLHPGGALYAVMLEKHGARSAARKLGEWYGGCAVLYKKKGIYVMQCQKTCGNLDKPH